MFNNRLRVLLITLLLSFAPLYAEEKLPINIEADEVTFDQPTDFVHYKRNVVVTQGKLKIVGDELTFYLTTGSPTDIKAKGNVKIDYFMEEKQEWVYGTGNELHFFPDRDELILIGDAVVTQAGDIMRADRINYDLDKEIVHATGTPKKRIHFTIIPKDKD